MKDFNGDWAFRGHGDASWPLHSTLARRFRDARIHPKAWVEQESRILRIFKRKAHLFLDSIPDDRDSFRWLAIMQHHGAPTRLLDFTWSPYVAAFFALENTTKDAAIWAISPFALSRPSSLVVDGKRQTLNGVDVDPWQYGAYEKYYLGNQHSFAVYSEPRLMDQRLIAQSGLFVIPSTIAKPLDEILGGYPNSKTSLIKFTLATDKLRRDAMFELHSMNIGHYTMFPGLDGLARSLAYESEHNWAWNPVTMKRKPSPYPNLMTPPKGRARITAKGNPN
jgi:hypothetical protein